MMTDSDSLALAKDLIRFPSVTPHDFGCQAMLATRLEKLGFVVENLRFGEVDNLWARRGNVEPLFVFCGHTDVVPPGPLENWTYPPFEPTVAHGLLYGRGASDMKSNIAAMVVACEKFLAEFPNHPGSIAFLITSDEEGPALNGVRKVMELFSSRGEQFTWCLVGEPSSNKRVGDIIKIGRRGSLSGKIKVIGKQGHIAYPEIADNPIHRALPVFLALCREVWDNGNDKFPPTSFQFSNIHAGVGVGNVIPEFLEAMFNFRYSPQVTEQELKQRVCAILDSHQLHYELSWTLSGLPFLTEDGELLEATRAAILAVNGLEPELSTIGGTSDARFIAPTGCKVLELGVCNHTIHQIDESISLQDLEELTEIYRRILLGLLGK